MGSTSFYQGETTREKYQGETLVVQGRIFSLVVQYELPFAPNLVHGELGP